MSIAHGLYEWLFLGFFGMIAVSFSVWGLVGAANEWRAWRRGWRQ